MKIEIHSLTIDHKDQRYNTCGDWWFELPHEDLIVLQIRVSRLRDPYMEALISIHEQVEALLCLKRGVDQDKVTAFDKEFEGEGEPGDSTEAPYHKEHFFATTIERLISYEFDVNWSDYDDRIEALE